MYPPTLMQTRTSNCLATGHHHRTVVGWASYTGATLCPFSCRLCTCLGFRPPYGPPSPPTTLSFATSDYSTAARDDLPTTFPYSYCTASLAHSSVENWQYAIPREARVSRSVTSLNCSNSLSSAKKVLT